MSEHMEPLIRDLSIKRYRALRDVEISGLGRVNLVTGMNNAGKTSLLEALRLLLFNAAPAVVYDILRLREEELEDSLEAGALVQPNGVFELSSLFTGFPAFSVEVDPIQITATGAQREMSMAVGLAWLAEEKDGGGAPRRLREQSDAYGAREVFPGLDIEVDGVGRLRSLDGFRRAARARLPQPLPERQLPCSFVSAYSGEQTGTLSRQWDAIALSELEREVVNALRLVDPKITAVSMIGGDVYAKERTAIVRHEEWARPMPLRTFGDGMTRVFSIFLGLVMAQNGLLLVDEVENGLHYSLQPDLWRAVFTVAQQLNVQVVATTHSWDIIESFQKAASATPEQGAVLRLHRRGSDIIPTVFTEHDLAIVTRDRLEVR